MRRVTEGGGNGGAVSSGGSGSGGRRGRVTTIVVVGTVVIVSLMLFVVWLNMTSVHVLLDSECHEKLDREKATSATRSVDLKLSEQKQRRLEQLLDSEKEEVVALRDALVRLQERLTTDYEPTILQQHQQLSLLTKQIQMLTSGSLVSSQQQQQAGYLNTPLPPRPWPSTSAQLNGPVIPVVVLTYNRADYLKKTLEILLNTRPPHLAHRFPIIVSQDGTNTAVWDLLHSREYSSKLVALQHHQDTTQPAPNAYKFIAQHYHWALGQVFDQMRHSQVILLEVHIVNISSLSHLYRLMIVLCI
eukprot:TRINITY_DN5635_c0_g1_i1.p1 TRINITY_DN5635_c0_g1~~TRINITY_DN5635_c0_g1_i1.p1  ORF type:complete len:302 (-),score=63.55 TRINITY_DN5635_c0_g1_i1:840-1745(-)